MLCVHRMKEEMSQMTYVCLNVYSMYGGFVLECIYSSLTPPLCLRSSEIEAIVREKGEVLYTIMENKQCCVVEQQHRLLKCTTPRMSSSKRRSLGLSLEEATSVAQLERKVHVRTGVTPTYSASTGLCLHVKFRYPSLAVLCLVSWITWLFADLH